MSDTLDQLYYYFSETAELDEADTKKLNALAVAKLAVLEEMERRCDGGFLPLMDVLGSLEAQTSELHSRALFFAAIRAGMELGRLQVG